MQTKIFRKKKDGILIKNFDKIRETKTAEEKVDEALVAVGDEQGLKNMIDGRESDESEEEDEEGITEEGKEIEANASNKLKEQDEDGGNKRESDDSDDEDPDATDINSPLLLQAKRQDDRKRAAGDSGEGSSQPKKVKTEKSSSQSSAPAAPLATSGASTVAEREQKNMLEDQIRRLLMRRPHTTKELLNLIRPQFTKVEKNVLVNKLAEVLKVIGPKQFRKLQGKKEVLYFSLEQ
uniref:Transcription initiation factor IIF subunit alpha n=1 Tax=Panagrolaimus superbus TaxID=310955 RepID=A0A914YJK9_9BILA